ncbi:MAG: beta strand repeat-containing protein [Verrucomicrobiia bacterium]
MSTSTLKTSHGPYPWGFRQPRLARRAGISRSGNSHRFDRNVFTLEALEPRLLLDGTILPIDLGALGDPGQAHEVTVRTAETDFVFLDDASGAELLRAPQSDVSEIAIQGVAGVQDKVTIDLSTPFLVPISFTDASLADNDSLRLLGGDQTWNITGQNAGEVAGVVFQGVENLLGATGNKDRFLFDGAGSVSGLVDGGSGGFDSLELVSGQFEEVIYTVTGPDSGTIDRDGDLITFAGLEPVTDNTGGNKTYAGTAGPDAIIISGSGGQVVIAGTGEMITYSNPGDITVNAGGGNDAITIESLGAYANKLSVDGEADADKLIVAQNVDMTLTNSSVTIGLLANPISLTSIELAELTGGASANNLDASGFSGNVTLKGMGGNDVLQGGSGNDTLEGGTGNDTYAFEDSWGSDTINGPDAGTDTLSFIGVTTALSVNNTTKAFSTTGGSLTQSGGYAEEINATLPVGVAAIESFLDNLLAYINKLQDGADGFAELFNQLPFINGAADGSISELTGLADAVEGFVTQANAALNAQTTLGAVASALNGLGSPSPAFDVWSLAVTTGYRGADPDATDGLNSLELLLDVALHAQVNGQSYKIDLGEEGALLGINLDASIDVNATLDAAFSIGIATGGSGEVFLVPDDGAEQPGKITLAVDAVANLGGSALHMGFLDLNFLNPSTIKLDGQVEIKLVDDAVKPDKRINLAAVLAGTPTIGDVTQISVTDPDADPYLQVNATLSVDTGVRVAGFDLSTGTITFAMGLDGGDPFGTSTGATGISVTKLEADLAGQPIDLLNFGNISPTDVMGMLGGVLDTLVALASSQFMQVVIPYTGKTVGDILDYRKSFKEEVLDPLFLSGDFLAPDANKDGAVSLPFFDNNNNGVVDAGDAALAELKIGSIQDLVHALADYLDIPGLTANYSGGELTFSIDFFRAFGLGDGDVSTTKQGETAVTAEVQQLKFQGPVSAFRLAFRDSAGQLAITNPIQVTGQTDAQVQAAIKEQLEDLPGIGSGKVTSVSGGAGVFNITFANTLGNLPQLGFAGELPLNFGASLGDFLGFKTTGSFGMAGILDTGLTFGIDLNPDTAVQIIPPVFAPNTVQVNTQPDGVNGAINEVVQVRVVEAKGDTYQLAFRPAEGSGSFTLIGPVTVNANSALLGNDLQTAFNTALGANAPVVTQPDPTNDPTRLVVTFSNGSNAQKDVELVGVREAGILSGAVASFEVSLFSEPAIGIETFQEGAASVNEVQKIYILNATGGKYTLTFQAQTTGPIDYNAPATGAGSVQEALEGLSNINPGDVSVTGGTLVDGRRTYTVEFKGALAYTNVGTLTADAKELFNDTALGSISVSVARDTSNTSQADLAADVQKAIDQALYSAGLSIGFNPSVHYSPGYFSTGTINENVTFTAADLPFDGNALPSDLEYAIVLGSGTFTGRLRAASVASVGIASALQSAMNATLSGKGVSVAVSTNADRITITPSGGNLELRVKSPIQAASGGGRISLNAPLAKMSFSVLEPAIEMVRRLQITVDYDNPAFQEMAIASSPTSFDGQITDDVDLTLKVKGKDVHVTLSHTATSTNANLDDLVRDLQQAVHNGLVAASLASAGAPLTDDIVQVKRVTINPDDPLSPKGNRIFFEGKPGDVTEMSVFVPDSPTNGAITELGLKAGQSETKRSKASSFFLENVSFGGNFGLYENEVAATASLGLLAVTAEMTGTVDEETGKFFGADVDFDLVNPLDGSARVTVDEIVAAIKAKQFLYQPGVGSSGFVDGVVSGGLGLTLALKPDGALGGLPITSDLGSVAISAQSPNWLLAPPSLTNPFGFALSNQPLAGSGVTVGISGNVLNQDMIFVLSQTIGSKTFATPVIVRAADTALNLTAADLETDIQGAINQATARLQRLVQKAGGSETVATVDAVVSDTTVTFTTATAVDLRGLYLDINFNKPAGLDDLLASLKSLSFDDIIAILQTIVGMLQSLDGSDDGSPLASVFDFNIPVIDRSIGDLVDLSGDFLDFVQELSANPTGSLQSLEVKLRSLLGLPAGPSILSLDTGSKTLYFDFGFKSSTSTSRPFNLDLADLNLGIFSQLVGLSASGNLGVQASIDFKLKLGLDLDGTDKAFFIDVAQTSLEAEASAFGNNLEFEASLGPVGVFVIGGSANLAGNFNVSLEDAGASSADGRLILAGFDGSGLTSDLGSLFSFLDMSLSGTGEVLLPMFYGLESSPAPMGNASQIRNFKTGENTGTPPVVDSNSHFTALPGNTLGLYADFLEMFTPGGEDGFEIRMPDFDLGDLSLPSLFSLLSDPGVIIKGLNSVLQEIQGVLQGELFGFELPLIGDALKDNPVATFIEDFRLDFLQPLADKIAESNLNLQGLLDLIEGVIDDVFSNLPGVGDILATEIDGSNHIYRFLDENGNETGVLDAKALQFDFDLGDTITKTLAKLNLNVPIPLLGISGQMDPTITVAWNLHFGFGIDLDKGFYFVSRYDKPNEGDTDDPELSFDVSLDLNSDDGTPAELEANLAILKLALTDGVDLNGSGVIQTDEYTRVFLDASLDLRDLSGGGTDGKFERRQVDHS